jgi:hypothetical protein
MDDFGMIYVGYIFESRFQKNNCRKMGGNVVASGKAND